MKYKVHQSTEPYADLDTIIHITRVTVAHDRDNTRAREFIQWVDSLGHKPTDAEFAKWCKSKGIQMRSGKRT